MQILGLQAEHHGGGVALVPDGLRGRIDGGLVSLNIGDGAGTAHRSVHLIGVMVSGVQHRGGFRELLFDIFGIDQQRVARRLLVAQVVVEIGVTREPRARSPVDLKLRRGLKSLARASRRPRRRSFS